MSGALYGVIVVFMKRRCVLTSSILREKLKLRRKAGVRNGVRTKMAFPEVPRVIYERNPLELVLCELRFPRILRIDAEIPSQFQDSIRNAFPFYEPRSVLDLPLGLPPEMVKAISQGLSLGGGQKSHDFIDRSRNWTVSLMSDKLTLSCTKYERWEGFKEFLRAPVLALNDIYCPPFYVRVGLRYRDVIKRDSPELVDAAWKDLLKPWIAGPYASDAVEDDIERAAHQVLIRLPDGHARILINHGLVQEVPSGRWAYAIDSDFFDDRQTEYNDVDERLDFFHQHAGRLFRWCIADRLHEAMRPRPVPGP